MNGQLIVAVCVIYYGCQDGQRVVARLAAPEIAKHKVEVPSRDRRRIKNRVTLWAGVSQRVAGHIPAITRERPPTVIGRLSICAKRSDLSLGVSQEQEVRRGIELWPGHGGGPANDRAHRLFASVASIRICTRRRSCATAVGNA